MRVLIVLAGLSFACSAPPSHQSPDRVVSAESLEKAGDMRLVRVADSDLPDDSQPADLDLGHEYSDYNREKGSSGGGVGSGARKALLYIPNRLMDLLDVFRVDIGVGLGYGFVTRITKYMQMGYRKLDPGSMRFGLRGRKLPVFLEQRDEKGIGESFKTSPERKVTPGELGVGADLLLVGAYAGVCFDELGDFLAGLVTYDFKEDDYR